MTTEPPATIVDVARRAGVSTATVSRTINGVGPVSDATDTRVREAIAELNYTRRRRQSSGRGLATTSRASTATRPVAFLRLGPFPMDQGHSLTDSVIDGLDQAARDAGRSVSVSHVPDLTRVSADEVVGDAEGVVIRTSNDREMLAQAVEWLGGIPAVRVLGVNDAGRTLIDHVAPDNAEVGALATEYLLEQECRHLVFASTATVWGVGRERCLSFAQAANEADVPVTVVVLAGDGLGELTRALDGLSVDLIVTDDRLELVRKIAEVNGGSFGLFMPRDLELAMTMPQLQVMGVDFAGKATAIGCDNEVRCLMELDPQPATIDIHAADVARRATRRLLYRIEHPDEPRVRTTVAPDVVRPTAARVTVAAVGIGGQES